MYIAHASLATAHAASPPLPPQGMLGKKQLEHLLVRLGLMAEGGTLPEAFPKVGGVGWVGRQGGCCGVWSCREKCANTSASSWRSGHRRRQA